MPRFPVSFGKRRSTAESLENVPAAASSFRVLDRAEVGNGKSFDGGVRLSVAKGYTVPKTTVADLSLMEDDNIFADLKTNRGSGSSNTTKTTSTDNSSRHSNASTAPSSATDYSNAHDESRNAAAARNHYGDIPVPPIPKSSSGFLKAAGRTFSFGARKSHPPVPVPEEPPQAVDAVVPPTSPTQDTGYHPDFSRSRAPTTSTTSTATPPKVSEDFDLGGDFSSMLSFDKRRSVMTLKDESNGRQALGPRSLTGNRLNQPTPLQIDKSSRIEASPLSWGSQHSGEQLLTTSPSRVSPADENAPPPVPRHHSPLPGRPEPQLPQLGPGLKRRSATYGRRMSADVEDEDTMLLKDISTASMFLASNGGDGSSGPGRHPRDEDTSYRQFSSESHDFSTRDAREKEDLFDVNLVNPRRPANRFVSRRPSPPRTTKVMTPAQFERYRKDKERQGSESDDDNPKKQGDDDEDNYEDDEDEVEKSKQAAKQRRKQEAHMAVYRQQMMKVTGETAAPMPPRASMSMSMSTPNLPNLSGGLGGGPSPTNADADESDEDEEVPLAILAAHGFPGKNRPPARLSTMMSNPNLKAAAQTPSYQRPSSAAGDAPVSAPAGGRLPVFARNLPQDPYVGAGLVNAPVRESLAYGGGAPAPGVPPGGLVGVIAHEERSRAMRRGSPAIDAHKQMLSMGNGFDPIGGIPPQMMYPQASPNPGMLTPADQAQLQMNQQMQQFMQMQMQFMQMMAGQGNSPTAAGPQRMSMLMPNPSVGNLGTMGGGMGMGGPESLRHSFVDNGSVFDLNMRPDQHVRSMSMVQPSSASWVQPPPQIPGPGYAPSIRIQGANGYAPSIAPSERSNIGLPGRYRPVSHMPAASPAPARSTISPVPPTSSGGGLGAMDLLHQQPQQGGHMRKSSTLSALGAEQPRNRSPLQNGSSANNSDDEEDEEKAWAAMQQKREKKRSMWKTKKSIGAELGALIS